jgi:dienelactone hydrolase
MGYNTRGWYGSRGPGRPTAQEETEDPENLGELSEMDVLNVVELTLVELSIDPNRVYLMGHSMGGGGVWHLGVAHPELWAGLAPVATATWSSPEMFETIPHIPVIVVQGEADPLVPVEIARTWVEKMEELEMTYEYIEVPDGDHTAIIARDPDNIRRIFDFFEAHEVWEELWTDYRGDLRKFYQGLIQAAVALHHFGNGNIRGAKKLYHSSRAYLEPYRPVHEGIDVDKLLAELEQFGLLAQLLDQPRRDLGHNSPLRQCGGSPGKHLAGLLGERDQR